MRSLVALTLLFLVGHWSEPVTCQAQPPSPASVAAKRLLADMPAIEGPTAVEPYKIVRIRAVNLPAKAGVLWEVDPEDAPLDYATTPSRDRLEFVAPPGRYSVRVLIIQMGEDGVILPLKLRHTVTIGKPGPGPDPTPPGPNPPDPTPPGPTPGPAPIPVDGFRVLMVYETAEVSKLPKEQQSVLYSKKVRDYMDSKCVANGGTKEWRIWDKDIDTSGESKLWQDAMKRTRQSIPWLIVSDGKTGYEGPLPPNVEATLELLKKYGGR